MRVHGAAEIDRAIEEAGAASPTLQVASEDLVTPLARDKAADHGVQIITEAAAAPAAPTQPIARGGTPPRAVPPGNSAASEPMRPPSPALYRRGAPLHPDVRPAAGPAASRPDTPARVVVIGAGHVGMITAQRVAEADVVDEVVLVDVADGLAAGVALDLTHTSGLLGFGTRVRGVSSLEEAGPADYVVITAGKPRQPGMSRADLVSTNAAIVGDLASRAARTAPDCVLVVVTNPLDEMTYHAWRSSGLPSERVVGMAGMLDAARFQALIGLTGAAQPRRVEGVALGSHGDEMVVPLSQATAGGRPVTESLDQDTLTGIVDRTRTSGGEVVGLLKSGSAFMAPGTAAAHMVLAMIRDSGAVLPVTARVRGHYGIADGYVGVPVRLGRHGVRDIVELALAEEERAALCDAAERINERVQVLDTLPTRATGAMVS
ncbi:hypothetical protein GCM10009676_20050 [Prauserella halophila]|uniref:Malate dehydrogenase n=1 Tax=Prauserella halophila TaxID=185641 RepID=A0ABN1W5C0_9PSEU|nr:malate dehydrogenase [Prauserella halophila]MCP2235799.1 malate dehydrogenase (NAD) (EC 1.1.1.37) [Prauserella halophila]